MIKINIEKAKQVAHAYRRTAREKELVPFDKAVIVNFAKPVMVAALEAHREAIRGTYAAMQTEIEAAATPDEIKEALNGPKS